ncbi:MAG: Wzz/FepE/Etk N-terminal domain-containing protein [Gallionella sp.]|nr:Wzz/FepE/Etk N-terminal domain-containing protein [Gallionella sp.]
MTGHDSGNTPEQVNPARSHIHGQAADADDEIDLLELWRTLLKYKRMILLSAFGAALLAAAISLTMPNIYRAEVLLAPAQSDDGKGGGLSAALGGLGGLASMAGVSLGGGGSTEESLAVLKSRDFLWKFVQEKKLMPILFEDAWDEQQKKWKETDPKKQPGQLDAHRLFVNGVLSVDKDKKTSLVTVAVEWEDASLAADWANAVVEKLNQYLAQQAIARSESNLIYLNEELMRTQVEEMRKTLFDLIANEQKQAMLANTQKAFAFKVLDPAVEPDKKIKPKRSQIVILTAIVAGFLAILYAFIKEGIAKRREEEIQDTGNRDMQSQTR